MSDKKITRRLNIYINDKEVKNNLKSIRSEMNRLRREIAQTTRGTVEYNQKTKELQRVKKVYRDMRKEIEGVPSIFQRMTKSAGGFVSLLGIGFGISGLVNGIRSLTRANAELSDMQADVMKTTGMTRQEVELLTKSLKNLDTRTSLKGLMQIAEEAGRLGKHSVKEVEEFVKVADKIGVALGDDLQGEVGENVRLIGKLVDIYKVGKKEGASFGYAMEMIGSAINEVSASGSENAGFLVEYLKRVGGVAKTTDIAADAIIGYAAVLDEKGQTVEASATAMNKILIDMFSNTADYAKVAGMSAKDFGDLLEKDTNEAFLKFLEGVKHNNAGLKEMSGKFDKLHIDGVRTISMLTTLANSTDTIRQKQQLANKALEQATSLTNEFNNKNNNLAGLLEKIGNKIKNAFYNESVKGFLYDIAEGFGRLVGVVKDSWEPLEKERTQLYMLELQLYDTNTPTEKRNKLIKDFIDKYHPKNLEGLDAETISNEQLRNAIRGVNEQLFARITLLKLEAIEKEKMEKIADTDIAIQEKSFELYETMGRLAKKYNVDIKTLGKTRIEQMQELKNIIAGVGIKSDSGSIKFDFGKQEAIRRKNDIEFINSAIISLQKERDLQQKDLQKFQKMFNKIKNDLSQKIDLDVKNNNNGNDNNNDKNNNDDNNNDDNKKSKHISKEKQYRAELLKIQRQYEDDKLSLMDEGYEKEKAKIDELYERKIEDLKNQKATKKDFAVANKVERKLLVEKNKEIDKLIELQQDVHLKNLQTLREKYLAKKLQDEGKSYKIKMLQLKTEHNEAVASIKSIADARKYLTDEELKGVRSVAEAKRKVQKKLQKDELKLQEKHLQELITQAKIMLASGEFKMEILTEDQKEKIKTRLEELKNKLSELHINLSGNSKKGKDKEIDLGLAKDIDIFGFSAQNWVNTFDKLDTTEEKIAAAEMAVQGLMNVWEMYARFMENNNQRELQAYERTLDQRKKRLKKQLDEGYITEAQYKLKVKKLEEDLDKKKAEIAYKQAQREKALNLFNAITNTALSITKVFASVLPPLSFYLAGIIGAMGAAQIALIASTPLPDKGYAEGGYTTGIGYTDESGHEVAGVVHAGEYVVPQFVMQDPVVPYIIQYLEGKRTGQGYADGGQVQEPDYTETKTNDISGYNQLASEISRLNNIIEKGIEAKIFFGNKEAFELEKIMDENKEIRDGSKL